MAKPKITKEQTVSAVGIAKGKGSAFGRASIRVHARLPAEHAFYALVGRVASEWSHLEHLLDLLIWDLLKHGSGLHDSVAACVTAQIMGVGPRCKAIISLSKVRAIPESICAKPIRSLMGAAYRGVADERARIVHDPWYLEKGTDSPSQFRAMPYSDPRYGHQEITREEIDATIKKIVSLQECAGRIRNDVLSSLHPSG